MDLKKKNPEAGLDFIKKIWNSTWNPAQIKIRYPEITKKPLYIYTYNLTLIPHFFSNNSERTHTSLPQFSPSLRHSHSLRLVPHFSLRSQPVTPTFPHPHFSTPSPPHPHFSTPSAYGFTALTHSQSLPHAHALTHAVTPCLPRLLTLTASLFLRTFTTSPSILFLGWTWHLGHVIYAWIRIRRLECRQK